MRSCILLIFLFSFLFSSTPKAVKFVDPKSFSGLWYEIARSYNSFQHDCVASTVEYSLKDTNKYKVFNRCFENEIGGNLLEYRGKAQTLDNKSMSRIKMTYFWVFSKEYKVIYLNNYKSAVVVDDNMEDIWIMSRTPKMDKKEFKNIISFLSKYVNTKDLIITPQDEKGKYK